MAQVSTKPQTDNLEHPSKDYSRRFPQDVRLRKAGFQIHQRRGNGEPVWIKDGVLYSEGDAIQEIDGR